MKIETRKRSQLILCTADWHLRSDSPVCRTETDKEFQDHQWTIIDWILDTAEEYDAVVFHAGDIFHKPCLSKEFENRIIELLMARKIRIIAIPGNHDMPQGNPENLDRSSYGTLLYTGLIEHDWSFCYQKRPPDAVIPNVQMIHKFIYPQKEKPIWADEENSVLDENIARTFCEGNILVSGDNHQSFVYPSSEGCLLINPGCITRQRAQEIDYRPSVYIANPNDMSFQRYAIPFEAGILLSLEHLERKVEIDEKIQLFLSKLNEDRNNEIDFKSNLENMLKSSKVSKEIKELVIEAMEG